MDPNACGRETSKNATTWKLTSKPVVVVQVFHSAVAWRWRDGNTTSLLARLEGLYEPSVGRREQTLSLGNAHYYWSQQWLSAPTPPPP